MSKPETKFGTFDELQTQNEDSMRPLATALKKLILEIHPDTVEVVRLGDNAATYGVGLKKMSEAYTYILPHKKWVNLGFFRGADLDDSAGLLEGTGKNMRHVKIKSLDMVGDPAVRALIEASLAERREALGV